MSAASAAAPAAASAAAPAAASAPPAAASAPPAAASAPPAPPAAAATETVLVDFCRARERLRAAEHATREERAEQNDAQRTLGSLLSDSMTRHGVTCVAIAPPGGGAGALQYARVVEGGRRAVVLRTREDALALLGEGVARALAEVPLEELPRAVPRLLLERARAKGAPTPARVRLVARPPRAGALEAAHAPPETRRLSEEFSRAVGECRATRAALKPLREEVRRCEAAAAPAVAAAGVASVRLERPPPPPAADGAPPPPPRPPMVLEISRRDAAPPPPPSSSSSGAASSPPSASGAASAPARGGGMGIRRVCRLAGEAAAALVARRVDRAAFDAALREELARRLDAPDDDGAGAAPGPARRPALRVRTRRATAVAA